MNAPTQAADADALCRQAVSFLETGQTATARPLLAAARALARPSPALILAEVRAALAEEQFHQAIALLDAAILDSPADVVLRKRRAEVRHRLGDWEGAARDAAEAITLAPAEADCKALLGMALLELGLVPSAIACLREAVATTPNVRYLEALSRALETSGDHAAALRVLMDGLSRGQAQISLFNRAMLLSIRHRDFVQAVDLAEQAGALGIADACTFGLKGHALCSLERHDEAAAAYQDALKLAPDDPQIRHLAAAQGHIGAGPRAPAAFLTQAFGQSAERFEAHLTALGYGIPDLICAVVGEHPSIRAGKPVGPVLDLGCGTGLVALALGKLPVGPFTGVDICPEMLAEARAKRLYAELREADIVADLQDRPGAWPLIAAADVISYMGDVTEILWAVRDHLTPDGWFIFSVESLLPDRDGVVPGNGAWALQRQGRYVHAHDYIYERIGAAGLRIIRQDRCSIRREAGADVPGLLLTAAPAVA
jgi:predicted TPR repeat methyltransferase